MIGNLLRRDQAPASPMPKAACSNAVLLGLAFAPTWRVEFISLFFESGDGI
jgi:hypothetical protein